MLIKEIIRKHLIDSRDAKTHTNNKKLKKSIFDNNELFYNIKSFGIKNPKKTFYVIQRSQGGLFSILNYVLHHLFIAEKFNFIPVVDMANYYTLYNEKKPIKGINNSWEYYFEPVSKYSLDEVYKSKNVIITDGQTRKNIFFDGLENLTSIHKKIFNKYIKIKKNFIREKDIFYSENFKNLNVLGVHFRGTDYKNRERHPYPATKKQITDIIDNLNSKYKYDKIFLVTEEKSHLDYLKKRYTNLIYFSKIFTKKKQIFFERFTNNIRYKIGRENLIDMLLLSSIKHVVGVDSNLISTSKYISKKKIIFFKIENGYNSKNIFIASFKWYLKSLLPKALGGLDYKIKKIK
tara:strand:- start:2420 stop:3463 length:1044 start_codon:yes stop_codon:yes gene_type:complete